MGMRSDCRHYDSRTYASGEVVRKCRLDLAPEAPWRCPEDCPAFELRRIDVGWQYGSLATAVTPPEPVPPTPDDASLAALLDEAEDIVNTAAPDIIADVEKKKKKGPFRRKRKKKKK
jgi:hypothetical protein